MSKEKSDLKTSVRFIEKYSGISDVKTDELNQFWNENQDKSPKIDSAPVQVDGSDVAASAKELKNKEPIKHDLSAKLSLQNSNPIKAVNNHETEPEKSASRPLTQE